MDTEKGVENMVENFVSEKQKNLENMMHLGSMDRWRNHFSEFRRISAILLIEMLRLEYSSDF